MYACWLKDQPHIPRAGAESDKFLLLPEDGDHAVALCKALPEGPNPNPNPITLTLTLTLTP